MCPDLFNILTELQETALKNTKNYYLMTHHFLDLVSLVNAFFSATYNVVKEILQKKPLRSPVHL